MKKIFFVLFSLLIINISVKGQDSNTKAQTEVKQALFNLFDGVSNFDMSSIKQNCTGDFLLLEDGKVWNLDSLAVKLVKPASTFTRTNALNFITVQIKGQTAWVGYHNTAHIKTADGKEFDINWLESATLINQKNRWLISLLHSTMIK